MLRGLPTFLLRTQNICVTGGKTENNIYFFFGGGGGGLYYIFLCLHTYHSNIFEINSRP